MNRDPRMAELAAAVEDVALTRHEGVTFEDQDVWLDGGLFVDCRFRRCRVHVELGRFELAGTTLEFSDCELLGAVPAERWRGLVDFIKAGNVSGPIN